MNTQDLRGDQRVAAFLLSLDKDKAAELMSHLDPEAVPSVAKAMLELDLENTTERMLICSSFRKFALNFKKFVSDVSF